MAQGNHIEKLETTNKLWKQKGKNYGYLARTTQSSSNQKETWLETS
jgi:hypothetical protein